MIAAVQTGSIRIPASHRVGRPDHPACRRRLAILRDGDWAAPLAICTYLISHPEWLWSKARQQ